MAQSSLGVMYYEGMVTQDYAEAAKWLRKAAEQGNANAQYYLGMAYSNGKGVTQDYVQAYMWCDLSAAVLTGELRETASKLRDAIAKKMTTQQIAEAQRLAREWKPKKTN